jgi:hypothetical protein
MTALVIELVGLTLVTVTVCEELVAPTLWFPNAKLLVENSTIVPVPESATVCGLPVALSLIDRLAVRPFLANGVKVMLMVQLAPAATDVPQVLVWLKSPGFVPVSVKLVMVSVPVPLLVSVTFCAALLVW